MFSPRDRFFAELVVAKGLATQQQVRASLTCSGAEDPGMLPRYLVAGRLLSEETRHQLERECDAWRRTCDCGEVFYIAVAEAPCPRCRKPVAADLHRGAPSGRPDLADAFVPLGSIDVGGSVSADLIAEPLVAEAEPVPMREQLGPYKIQDELGRGGMGVVYRAIQEPVGRTVALKVLLEPRGKRRERFVREARAAARLEHPNIVRVHDVGEAEGVAYFSMAFLEGKALDRVLLEEGKLAPERALEILEPIARAVHHAHEHKLIHRDLKPGNILMTKAGPPVLIDFGLARALDDTDDKLTRTGVAIGTPHYMSPEQVRGVRKEIDVRTDVWALGVILFELIVGERPFKGDTAAELYASIQLGDPPRLRSIEPSAPASVEAIILKALDRNKENRYQSARELADELAHVRRGESPSVMKAGERLGRASRRAKRKLRAAAVFLVGLVVIAGAGFGVRVFLGKRDRDLTVARGVEERESIKKKAASLVLRARARTADAGQSADPRVARAAAEDAVAAIGSLEEVLLSSAGTEPGREEARLQAASADALVALREAFVARARAALRGARSDSLEVAERDLARARAGAQDDVELAALHASTLCSLERAPEGEAALSAALAAHPEEPLLLLRQGEAKLASGAADAGLALVDRAYASRSNEPTYRLARARARLRAGRASAALEDAQALAKDPEAVLVALEAWLALGRIADARSLVRDLVQKHGGDDLLALRARALLSRAREDEEGEKLVLTRLIAKRPDDAEVLAARGHARLVLREEDAASDLRAAAEHAASPRRRVALRIELAQLEDATGRGADAARDLDRALAAAGDDGFARALVHVAHARRALMGLVEPAAGAPAGTGHPDLARAREALAAAADASREAPGVAATRAWLALEDRDVARALELVAAAPRDVLAVSVELAARRTEGAADLSKLEAEAAALALAARDPVSALERRALRDLRLAPCALNEGRQAGVWESSYKNASWAVALAPRRALGAAVAGVALLHVKKESSENSTRLLALAAEWHPGSAIVQLASGLGALARDDGPGAARAIGRAIELSPDDLGKDPLLHQALAEARLHAKDGAGAERAARKALELEPANFHPLRLIEKAAELRGDAAAVKAAADEYKRAHKTHPSQARHLAESVKGELASLRGVAALEKAVALSPRDAVLWRDLCYARFGVSDMVGAWRAWTCAIQLEPYTTRHDLEEQSYLSTVRLRQITDGQDFERAVAAVQEAEPRAAEVHFLHAWTSWSQVEFAGGEGSALLDRAIADLDRAIALDRRFGVAWALRGHIRALQGEVGTARADLHRAHDMLPGRMPIVHAYLASLQGTLGDADGALKELEAAVKEGWTDRARLLRLPGVAALKDEPRIRALVAKLPDAPVTGLSEGF